KPTLPSFPTRRSSDLNITNTLSLSTGNDQSQTYISLGSVNASGIVHSNNYERYNMSFRNTSKILREKATLDISFMGSNVNEDNIDRKSTRLNSSHVKR